MKKVIKDNLDGKRFILEQFDNLDEFVAACARPSNSVFRGKCESENTGRDALDFTMTNNFAEAENLLRNGWTDRLDEVRREMASFEKTLQQDAAYEKKRPATSPVGFAPHVPNAIKGLPNSMIRTEHTPVKTKIVRIVYKMSMNASWNAEKIMKSGLLVLKFAHALEKKGLRVRIDVSPKFSNGDSERVCALVCIKDWRQPLDLKKIAFPIAHPSMFRRFGFKWMETAPDIQDRGFSWGYGRSDMSNQTCESNLSECGVFTQGKDYFLDVFIADRCKYDVKLLAKELGCSL